MDFLHIGQNCVHEESNVKQHLWFWSDRKKYMLEGSGKGLFSTSSLAGRFWHTFLHIYLGKNDEKWAVWSVIIYQALISNKELMSNAKKTDPLPDRAEFSLLHSFH